MTQPRPDFFELHNGDKAVLPFSNAEYEARLNRLRELMSSKGVDAMLLTSMQMLPTTRGFFIALSVVLMLAW